MSRSSVAVPNRGGEQGQDDGTAGRRQRSEAGRKARVRSSLIVPMRSGNPPQGTRGREAVDRAMGLFEGKMMRTLSREIISTRQEKLAELAQIEPKLVLTTLAHHIDEVWLREAYRRTRKDGAAGADGVTAEQYEVDLEISL
ncbi:hypothetical protein N9H39_00815 [Gammaproteobacteria bacterium]|nr:hypothetical protein [Gammaproteobacteria bacterium]